MEELLLFLNNVATLHGWPLSEKCLAYLRTIIQEKKLKKDEILLRPPDVCTNLYFIREGLLKCYYLLRGNEVCDWFFGEGETVVSIDSFYDQLPSIEFIQSLEDCILYYITHEELEYLYRTFVEFNVVGRVLTNKYLRIWHRHAKNIRMLSAEERYQLLLDTQPELVRRVSVQDLSSHLDMRRETLSRVRGKI